MICVDSFPVGDGPGRERETGGPSSDRIVRGRNTRKNRAQPHAFWKAGAIALFPVLPAIGAAIWLLARVGVGNRSAGIIEALRLAGVFAGPATVLTAGGVGRLAAQAGAERGRRQATWVAARTLGVAGAALAILAAIPLGHLPVRWPGWAALMVTGVAVGAAGGAVIGWVVGGPMPTLSELGLPERYQLDPMGMLRRAGARRATRRKTGQLPPM